MRDEQLCVEIAWVHRDNLDVYAVDKVWAQLNREGSGWPAVERRMGQMDPSGAGEQGQAAQAGAEDRHGCDTGREPDANWTNG